MSAAASRRALTGPEKVGLLLVALGQERASVLLKRFDPEELNTIMRSTEAMPTVSTPQLAGIVEEFEERFGKGLPFVGTADEVKRLVSGVIQENRLASNSPGQIEERDDLWTRLPALADDVLFGFLSKQHPQASACMLSRIGSERSSTLLRFFSGEQRNELLLRILGMGEVRPVVIAALEQSIQKELFETDTGSSEKHLAIAAILNNFDRNDTSESLTYLSGLRPKDAEAIRKLLFKFEDLIKLSPKALTVLMDGVPVERVVIALQGTDREFQQKVLAALSPRARRMAEAELQSGATASPRDLNDSRRAIVDSVLKMVAEGAIDLAAGAPAVS